MQGLIQAPYVADLCPTIRQIEGSVLMRFVQRWASRTAVTSLLLARETAICGDPRRTRVRRRLGHRGNVTAMADQVHRGVQAQVLTQLVELCNNCRLR